jgi:hypothetical protein
MSSAETSQLGFNLAPLVCHSERSEESIWRFDTSNAHECAPGFFAALRMTNAGSEKLRAKSSELRADPNPSELRALDSQLSALSSQLCHP